MSKKEEIKKLMKNLDLTEEEAIEAYEFDHENAENEEAAALQAKADEAHIMKPESKKKKGSSLDKVKNQKAKKKIDEIKDNLMNRIMSMLFLADVHNPVQVTASKVTFRVGEEYYSITLTKHKSKPDGYSD